MRHRLSPAASLAGMALLAAPLGAGVERVGTTAAAFTKLGAGARPAALGEAFVALADDASALNYNPAGMSQMLSAEVQATHTELYRGLRYENLNAVFSLGDGGMLGATFNFLSLPSLQRTEQVANTPDPTLNYIDTGSFTPYDLQFAAAYSRPVLPGMLVGANMKLLAQSIDDRSTFGLGLDLGVLIQSGVRGLTTGLAVQNLGTPIKLKREAYELPWVVRAGAAYRVMEERLTLLAEADMPADNDMAVAFGLEYAVSERFYPRAGFRYNGIFNPWSLGMGMKFGQVGVDLSIVPYGELGLTYRGSASYRFGQPTAGLETRLPHLTSNASGRPAILLPRISAPDKVAAWALYIYDSGRPAKVVRRIAGRGGMEQELAWDGRLDDGRPAPEGAYFAILSARYATGKVVNTKYLRLDVNNTPPQPDLSLDPGSLNPQAAGEAFVPTLLRLSLKGGRAAKSWRMEILDSSGKVFRTYEGQGAPPETLAWDGKGDQRQSLTSGQVYSARLWAADPLGLEAMSPTPLSFKAVFR